MIGGLLGVIHLHPMPGDPGCPRHESASQGFQRVKTAAWRDAEALVQGGVDGLIIENFGSAPFAKGDASSRIPPQQVALIALVVDEIRRRFEQTTSDQPLQLGVNCLRNDVMSALGIAAACGLGSSEQPGFVRVNIHSGSYLTDQGLIEGEAHQSLRFRHSLGATTVALFADVLVKHAQPLAPLSPTTATQDCLERGMADGVIVTGEATGAAVSLPRVQEVIQAAGGKPVLIGSGFNPIQAQDLAGLIHGAIVGTWFKEQGKVHHPVDKQRVRDLVRAVSGRFRTSR